MADIFKLMKYGMSFYKQIIHLYNKRTNGKIKLDEVVDVDGSKCRARLFGGYWWMMRRQTSS